jgi:hypothetical protein
VVAAVAAVPPGAVTRTTGRERRATKVAILDRDMGSPTLGDPPLRRAAGAGAAVPLRMVLGF